MSALVDDANRRFDFAKALLARAVAAEPVEMKRSFAEAAVSSAFSCLEGMLSNVFEHFANNNADFNIFEQSIMNEKAVKISKGKPILAEQRFQSVEDRLQYLFWKFSGVPFDTTKVWWHGFAEAVRLRNSIMHPKEASAIDVAQAERALEAVLLAIDDLLSTVFNSKWPKANKGLMPSFTI